MYTFCVFRVQPKESYDKRFIMYSFCGLIASNLLCLCVMIQYVFINLNQTAYDFEIFIFGDTFAETFYILSCILMYLVFLCKIQVAFEGTRYQIGTCVSYVCYICMIIFFLLKLVDIIVDIGQGKNFLSSKIAHYWRIFYFLSLEIIDLSLSGVLISLFVKKLMDVTVDLTGYHHSTQNSKEYLLTYSRTVQLNDTQKGFLNVITKHSVLSITSVICAQIYFIILTTIQALDEWNNFQGTKQENISFNVAFIFWGLDGFINCLCICMNQDFNHKLYYILCGKCHRYCKICCVQKAKAKIDHNHQLELQQQLLL